MVTTDKFRSASGVARRGVISVATDVGGFYRMSGQTFRFLFRRPFERQEVITQAWFIARVALVPTMMVAIPFCVIVVFQLNQLMAELGATDLSGAGAGLSVVREIGPLVSVLVVAGAGGTAVCADLGARKIRDEIDAIEVLGLNPVQRLVVPRVIASTVIALALNGIVTVVGLTGSFLFTVLVQHASAGQFVASLTLLTNLSDFLVSELKAAVFGLLAGLVACYLGIKAKGGPKGVGDAVNQTVVFSFMLLFLANSIISAVFLQTRY
ncbi:ABC transporter permease [Rhodococcus sp. SC4]|nr:ABC transporter permease [Rhodococcus sp. SC4]